jgi:hypothetical protein
VPMALMIGQCGGNVALFQSSLKNGDIVEVQDPRRPASKLYKWTAYRSSAVSEVERRVEGTADMDARQSSLFDALDLDFEFVETGTKEVAAVPGSSSTALPAPLALADATVEQKVWLKVTEACRVGQGIVFKTKLAVSGLGKSTVARASAAALNALIGELEDTLTKFGQWAMKHSAGDTAGLPDAASLNTELKDFHAALAELSKGEKSALALKDKVAKHTAAAE